MTDIARTAATQTQVLAIDLGLTDSAQKEIIQKHLVAMLAMERERMQRLDLAVEFAALWAWREDPLNASRKLTDAERLSAIKYHPTIKATWERVE